MRRLILSLLVFLLLTTSNASTRAGEPLPQGAFARLGSPRLRHEVVAGIESRFLFSPDGRYVASCNYLTIRLWDNRTGALLWEVGKDKEEFRLQILFSPDGTELVAAREGNLLEFWDVRTGKLQRQWTLRPPPDSEGLHLIAFSDDGRLLVLGDNQGRLELRDTRNGQLHRRLNAEATTYGWHLSRDQSMLTSWGKDGVSRWDVMRGKLLGESPFPVKGWRYVAHTADLSRFALYVPKQGVTFWEPASGKVTGKLKGEKLTVEGGLAFTPDGKRLMTLHAAEKERTSTAKLWDVASGELLRSFPLPPFQGLGPAFSPDGKTVILPAMGPGFHLWDVDAGKPQLACEGHQFSLGAVAFTPDGKTILTGSTDLVQTWDVATGKPRLALEGRYFAPLAAVMLDNRSALIAGADRSTLRLYDLASGKAVGSFTLSAEEQPGYGALRRSADGKMILGLGQDEGRWKLSLWELATGKRVQERLLRADEPYDDLLAGGDWLAGILRGPATDTKDVPPANVPDVFVVHDWKKERVLLRVELPGGWDSRAVESPDRQTLATIATELVLTETGNRLGRSYVQLWEIASGQVRLEIVRDPGKPESYFAQLALSPDGRTLATVWDTRAIQLWDVVTGKELLHLQAESQIQQLVFSPDGRTLATGLNDGTVLLWDVRSATERKPPRRELGQLGTAEARTVLAALAKGDPAARTTQAAQAALTRLGQ